jgi:hypothetical protein
MSAWNILEKLMNFKRMLYLPVLAIAFFPLVTCGQWRVSELAPSNMMTVKAGTDTGKVSINFTEDDYPDISFTVNVGKDRVFIADNRLKRLQIFDKGGSIKGLISAKKTDASVSSVFNFGIIGDVDSDSDGRIYVQNRIDSAPSKPVPAVKDDTEKIESGINPSFILVFDSSAKLQYTMGQRGSADTPFYRIETISVDSDDRLWVICKGLDTWSVYRFKNKNRDFYTSFGKDTFGTEKEGNIAYNAVIENVLPFHHGNSFLISIAYYSNTRFKYRKIVEYSVPENKISRILAQVPDPRNELFSVMDDKYLLLWDTEEKNLKFAIWDLDGNVVNHHRIKFGKDKSYYTRVFTDDAGKIYSYSVKKNGIDVFEWK